MINKRFFSKKGTIGLLLTIAIAMVLVATMMWQGATMNAYAIDSESVVSGQVDVHREVSLEDDFTDDIILVTLSQKASLNSKRYKISDFPEVKLARIIEITESLTEKAEKQ